MALYGPHPTEQSVPSTGFDIRRECEDHRARTIIVSGLVSAVAGYLWVIAMDDDSAGISSTMSERLKVTADAAGRVAAF